MNKIKSVMVAAAVLASFPGAAMALEWQVYDAGWGQHTQWDANLVTTGDGFAHAPNPTRGFTDFELYLPDAIHINGDNLFFEARIKNPAAEGGAPAYDVYLAGFGRSSGLGTAVAMMDGAGATGYAGAYAGTTSHSGVGTLVQDLQSWHTIGIQTQNGVMSVLYDNASIYSFSYQSPIGELGQLHIGLKGTGTIDWANVYSDGVLALQSDMTSAMVADGNGTPITLGSPIPPSSPVTAVPEPKTYGMLLAGLGLIAGIARSKRPSLG